MKTLFKSLAFAAALTFSVTGVAHACESHQYQLGSLKIDHPFARATVGPARVSATYVVIENSGEADRLVSASTDVSEKVELHTMELSDGVMRMREVEGGIDVPAGGKAVLEPGGLHIMLLGLTQELVEGERFPMTLTFEQAGEIEVEVVIEGAAAGAHSGHDHHDHGHDQSGHKHGEHDHHGHHDH